MKVKPREIKNPLIIQLRRAIQIGNITEPFSQLDFEKWISDYQIVKGDGTKYAKSSIKAFLYNSYVRNKSTTNTNVKRLRLIENEGEERKYEFMQN